MSESNYRIIPTEEVEESIQSLRQTINDIETLWRMANAQQRAQGELLILELVQKGLYEVVTDMERIVKKAENC